MAMENLTVRLVDMSLGRGSSAGDQAPRLCQHARSPHLSILRTIGRLSQMAFGNHRHKPGRRVFVITLNRLDRRNAFSVRDDAGDRDGLCQRGTRIRRCAA